MLFMSLCLIKDISKCYVFINMIFQKHDPKQQLIFQILEKIRFDTFYVDNLIMDHLTIWKENNFHLLQLIVLDIMRIFISFFIFFNIQTLLNKQIIENNCDNPQNSDSEIKCQIRHRKPK